MPTVVAPWNDFTSFRQDLSLGKHVLDAASDVVKAYLSNFQPLATHTVKADIAEIAAGNGYVAGGVDIQNDIAVVAGSTHMTGVSFAVTANGGTVGPFQFVVFYNSTHASDLLMGWYDYLTPVTLQDGEPFNVNLPNPVTQLDFVP